MMVRVSAVALLTALLIPTIGIAEPPVGEQPPLQHEGSKPDAKPQGQNPRPGGVVTVEDPERLSGSANNPLQDPASNPASGQGQPRRSKAPSGPQVSGKAAEGPEPKRGADTQPAKKKKSTKTSKSTTGKEEIKPMDAVIRRPRAAEKPDPLPYVFLGCTIAAFLGAMIYAASTWRKGNTHGKVVLRRFDSTFESDFSSARQHAPVKSPQSARTSLPDVILAPSPTSGPAEKLRIISSKSDETMMLSPSKPVLSVGSHKSMDIVLAGEHVLPHHASIEKSTDGWTIKGTTGPITVNGEPIAICPLTRGQVIEIGSCRIQILSRGD